jgi:argininosuccinate lyase
LLIESAEKYQNVLLPGYTLTNCDAITGMWFSAYAETLIDDITMHAALVVDQNPLGSAAGYGSPSLFMLYHQRIGFETLKYNSVAAQMSRGKSEKTLAFAIE